MTVAQNDILRVTARMVMNLSDDIQNVYHLKHTTVGGISDAEALADAGRYLETIYGQIYTKLPSDQTFTEVDVFNVTQDKPLGQSAWPSLVAGTKGALGLLPQGVSFLCVARTGESRRVGRKFFGIMHEDDCEEGLWTTGVLTAMAGAVGQWIANYVDATTGNTYTPGVWSTVYLTFLAFVEGIIKDVPAYQRRRKRGVGA